MSFPRADPMTYIQSPRVREAVANPLPAPVVGQETAVSPAITRCVVCQQASGGKMYCSSKCKQQAYRMRRS